MCPLLLPSHDGRRPAHAPIFALTRGEIVESLHYGSVAVVDVHGKLVAGWGDPFSITYLRSSAKPFQVLPFLEQGGIVRYGLVSAGDCPDVRLAFRHG